MASSLLSGERVVVALFTFRIIYSTSLSHLYESISLSLLFLFALFVEISLESSPSHSSLLNTRPGASSGVLLGAVSLPGVMFSRMILNSRAVSLNQVGAEDLEYLRLQYWATTASCFSVLVYLCFILCHKFNQSHLFSLHGYWRNKLNIGFIALCAALFCVSTAKSFSGEALLVTSGLVIYFGDMFACTLVKIYGYVISTEYGSIHYGIERDEISTIIQGVLLGLLLFPFFFKHVTLIWQHITNSAYSEAREDHQRGRAALFYVSLACILILIVPSWMQLVHQFPAHPLLWVFNFVFSEPLKRLSLCIYWVFVIYASVLRFYNISKSSKIERILLRKYYHLMAVLMFVPALILQPKFLNLAFGAALAAFLMLEIIRVWRIWPLGHLVHQFLNAFTDHRDSDLLIVSHFSLLLGCALPIWMSSGFNDRPLAPFAGILSLGIGDTMASMVGHKYGVLRWSKTGKKTIEGTAAGITSVLAACSILLPILATTGYIFTQHWFSLLLAVTLSGLLEAYTAQLDNAFIPLVFYSLLCI
ncbi:hypothetical protein AgCh_039372 [Apium graveolens]